ncbi:hypothetical protein Cantr_08316 [Candida viswanathii]|uniref:Protein BNI4 n=1 Tax=Candida viswanathii TaxID=5486 RepID=A0A367Y4U1_9ASCO|nr:hypothetical protein Cantr_08316 [Candida viswanathii]
MTDSTFDEFFDNEFYSAPTSAVNDTKNHMKNVRNSIQIKHSMSSKSLRDFTANPQPTATTTSTKSKRTSAIKASPSLKALETILNEKSKQYNTGSTTNVNAILEEEEEENDDANLVVQRQQTKLSPPVTFSYNRDVGQSVQTFETATESLAEEDEDDDGESTLTNSNNNNSNTNSAAYSVSNSIFNNNYLTKKTSKASSANSHKYNKSSISTISEGGYSTDETPVVSQPLTFQSFTPHSHDSPLVKMVDIKEEYPGVRESNFEGVHEQNNNSGTMYTNNVTKNNYDGVTIYNNNNSSQEVGSKFSSYQQQQQQQHDGFEEEHPQLVDLLPYPYPPDQDEMPQKNSHSLQPPRHIKLPTANRPASPLSQNHYSTGPPSSSPARPSYTSNNNNSSSSTTIIQSNNPFYPSSSTATSATPAANTSDYHPPHSHQKYNSTPANRNVPAPSLLQQPAYPGSVINTSNNLQHDAHLNYNNYTTSGLVHRTNSNMSSSNISVESSNSSLTNSSVGPRPKIVRKSKSMLSVLSHSESLENVQKPVSPLPATPKQSFATGSAVPASASPKKSPHLRSNSAFSLNFPTNESTTSGPPRPLKHKRSSTMNDLSRLNHDQPTTQPSTASAQSSTMTNNTLSLSSAPAEKKKFSFKSLFKSRSKNHSLNAALEPKKLTSKSYSTPNMQTLSQQSKKVEPQQEQTRPQPKTNNSFMNRFMKNKSSENLSKMGAASQEQSKPLEPKRSVEQHKPVEQNKPAEHTKKEVPVGNPTVSPVAPTINNKPVNNAPPAKPAAATTSTKATADAMAPPSLARPGSHNFIREISDDSVYVGRHDVHDHDDIEDEHSGEEDRKTENESYESGDNYDQLSYSRSIPEEDDFDYYDAKNLNENPPQKLTPGNQYGEEIALLPPLLDSNQFGSPFKVNYQSSPQPNREPPRQPRLDESPIQRRNPQPAAPIRPPQNALPSRHPEHHGNNNQLLGEALFPKSLNAHEVESIVSLERSRSMKSVKSNKRNSFVNYDGSDDNIVHYVGPTSNPTATSGMTRSNSILKNSTSRRSNLNEELTMNSIDANISQYAAEMNTSNHNLNTSLVLDDDLMEFSEFIDVDNLNFTDSPLLPGTPVRADTFAGQANMPPSPLDIKSFEKSHPQPQQRNQEQSPVIVVVDKSNVEEPKPSKNAPVSIDSRTPSSSPLSMEHIESPKTSVEGGEHMHEKERVFIDLTKGDDSRHSIHTTPEPEDEIASDAATEVIKSSPILESAYRTRQSQEGTDDVTSKARPLSMSFKGLNAPSFSGKFKNHDLRSSDSHQSFNINFNDDSSSSVGGGFGTSSDDEYESEEDHIALAAHNREAGIQANGRKVSPLIPPQAASTVNNHSPLVPPATAQSPATSVRSSVFSPRQLPKKSLTPPEAHQQPLPPKKFSHNKIPSISDQSSINSGGSPRSFTSMISKKWGNKKSPVSSPRPAPPPPQIVLKIANGVRFSSRIILYDTYNEEEYDRHPDTATCNQLTPMLAQQIKEELNTFKGEMDIHVESRCYTHFF